MGPNIIFTVYGFIFTVYGFFVFTANKGSYFRGVADVACIETTDMNTKTMRLPPRRVLTPSKRKEREGPDNLKPSTPTKLTKPASPRASSEKGLDSASSNHLLAGYLAHEYLTKGTLFGQPWEPARAEAVPVSGVDSVGVVKPARKAESEPNKDNYERYVEVSRLLKIGGPNIPDIINPTQLARFLQM